MKSIGSFEAKTQLSKLLAAVEKNKEEILIQRRGVNIAVLIPFEDFHEQSGNRSRSMILDGLRDLRAHAQPASTTGTPVPYKEWINEGRKR